MKNYGKELILDLHGCDPQRFTRKNIKKFLVNLCLLIDMERQDLHWWDYKGYPKVYGTAPAHLKGTSVIQFITTSNITIHTLDELKRVYINIFSCKEFDEDLAMNTVIWWFKGRVVNKQSMIRM